MKLAFFFFFSLSTLLGAYHARHLHDFLALPIPSYDETIDGRDYLNAQPSPQGAAPDQEGTPPGNFLATLIPSYDETIDGRDYLNAQPSPQGAAPDQEGAPPGNFLATLIPSYDESIDGRDYLNAQPSPQGAGTEGQGAPPAAGEKVYVRDNPKASLLPRVASRGQTTYSGAGVAKKRLSDFLALLIPSYDETIYGRDYLKAQPSPQGAGSDQEGAPPEGEGVYNRDNPKAPPSPPVDISMDRTTYDRDDSTTPPSLDPNEGGRQGRFDRVDPIHLVLSESKSTFDGGRINRNTLRDPAFTSDIQIKRNEDQSLSIASH